MPTHARKRRRCRVTLQCVIKLLPGLMHSERDGQAYQLRTLMPRLGGDTASMYASAQGLRKGGRRVKCAPAPLPMSAECVWTQSGQV